MKTIKTLALSLLIPTSLYAASCPTGDKISEAIAGAHSHIIPNIPGATHFSVVRAFTQINAQPDHQGRCSYSVGTSPEIISILVQIQ